MAKQGANGPCLQKPTDAPDHEYRRWACWIVLLALLLIPAIANAKRAFPEKKYQEKWCEEQDGRSEVVLDDRTRCDCLTRSHAIEFDFASKWAEAVGQSLYYSHKTGKKAGIVLILEDKKKDRKYLSRLEQTIKGKDLQIKVWTVEKSFVSKREDEKSICFIASADEAIWQMPAGGFAEGFCLLTAVALFAVIRFLMICSKRSKQKYYCPMAR